MRLIAVWIPVLAGDDDCGGGGFWWVGPVFRGLNAPWVFRPRLTQSKTGCWGLNAAGDDKGGGDGFWWVGVGC